MWRTARHHRVVPYCIEGVLHPGTRITLTLPFSLTQGVVIRLDHQSLVEALFGYLPTAATECYKL
jgi:hypothetical protein